MSKNVKRILAGLGIAAFLVVAGLIPGAIVRSRVEKALADLGPGPYHVTCEAVGVNIFRKSLRLKGVRVKTAEEKIPADSAAKNPILYLDAQVDEIVLRGISLKALKNKSLDLSTLLIDSPRATIVTHPVPADAADGRKKGLPASLTVVLGQVGITNGSLLWQQITGTDTLEYRIAHLNLRAQEFRIDTTRGSRERFLLSAQVTGSAESFRTTLAHRDYVLALDSLEWSRGGRAFSAAVVSLIPQHAKNRFTQESARHSDYMQLGIDRIACSGVDFDALWNERAVRMDSVHIPSGRFETYKNRKLNYPRRIKPMIHRTIQQLGIPVDIRRIRIDGFDAAYEELAAGGHSPGRIAFNGIDATVSGFTNRAGQPEQHIEIQARANVMNAGKLDAKISLPVDPANDRFEVKAALTALPMTALNPMIVPLARIEIESGRIARMDFAMSGGSTAARVDMALRYSELKVALMKTERGKPQPRNGLSRIVNLTLIKSDNPDKGGLRTVQTTVERDPYRSSFNYLWKGVSAGAVETVETGAAKRLLKK